MKPGNGTRTAFRLRIALAVAGTGVLLAACSSGSAGTNPSASASVASGAVVGTVDTALGTILVDPKGNTIYTFAADKPGVSNCTGSCASIWPPVPAGSASPTAPAGISATLGSLKRSDGTLQLTVNGLPVYTYLSDHGSGSTAGQGINSSGGLWWVVNPAGAPITSGSAPSTSTSKSGGGWA